MLTLLWAIGVKLGLIGWTWEHGKEKEKKEADKDSQPLCSTRK